jgi:FolB domain-containing protein
MDYIHINNLIFRGTHGILPKELTDPQEFEVSLRLGTDTRGAAHSDAIADALDYRAFKEIARAVIEGKHRNLLETLAEDIAAGILKDSRVHTAEVGVTKCHIWNNGVPSVVILRTN